MKQIAVAATALMLALSPATAQQAPQGNDMEEGLDLLGEGMRLFFKGLTDEMEPAMREFAESMEPAMREMMRLIDDLDAYEMPEKLPNGDIIIRRKPDAPLPEAEEGDDVEI